MLKGRAVNVKSLSEETIKTMFSLMQKCYENIIFDNFLADLKKKEAVLLLCSGDGCIHGFTSITFIDQNINGKDIKLIFSGDTVVSPDYWGEHDLMFTWIKYIMDKVDTTKEPVYWLLLSKGHKTYKYLTFLKEFYPRYDKVTPEFEKKIIDTFGNNFYPDSYNSKNGVVELFGTKDYMRREVNAMDEKVLKDKNIQFFLEKNPGYALGNELVCVALINRDNLRPVGRRILEHK